MREHLADLAGVDHFRRWLCLGAQPGVKIAIECFLPDMSKLDVGIDIDLAAELSPSPAKVVVLTPILAIEILDIEHRIAGVFLGRAMDIGLVFMRFDHPFKA